MDKLIYLTVTRPDIAYAVGLVSQFMHKPREVHWKAALRILTYIKKSPEKGLLFKRNEHLRVEPFSDSNYAGDRRDRKSTSCHDSKSWSRSPTRRALRRNGLGDSDRSRAISQNAT